MATYTPDSRGRCPHCLTVVRFERVSFDARGGPLPANKMVYYENENLYIIAVGCPECGRLILTISSHRHNIAGNGTTSSGDLVLWPLQSGRPPVSKEVPDVLAVDYNEAALVLSLSPKASAALSRRCLQALLRAQNHNQKDLWQQIDAALPELPSYIAPHLDHVRHIGNFAAHPMKSTASGEILDVEPGEAEWNLTVLEELFDHYYVKPAEAKKRHDALNAKLIAAGKQPMK